jgi:outer membrane protein OmpA-like peptidoglycan-associated protein
MTRAARLLSRVCVAIAVVVAGALVGAAAPTVPHPVTIPHIPLCPGLTVVTAIGQANGDYESIKTIESISDKEVMLKYSTEHMVQEFLSNKPAQLVKLTVHRRVLNVDLKSAKLYEQIFYQTMPDQVAGSTAIGTSSDELSAFTAKGEGDIGIFIAMTGTVSGDRNVHPNVYDFQMIAHVKRVEPNDVMLPVIVNDAPALLPAVHVAGDFFGDKTEFYFLDDPANPLTLKYRYGIGSASTGDLASVMAAMNSKAPPRADKDDLDVTKIAFRCAATPASSSQPAGGAPASIGAVPALPQAPNLEQQLSQTGKAEIYDIYFSFNSADIRPESEASLKEIAGVLGKHPDWKLNVAGNTDNIGGAAFNLGLSQRRAASIKNALTGRYHIDAARLSTTGYGASRPQDTNETLEGRARNRRVELTRQ